MRSVAEYCATRKSQCFLVTIGVREKRKMCYTLHIQTDIFMAQSAFSDDDDDSGFGLPSSGGGFAAQGRAGVGGGGSRWSTGSRDPFGAPPREKKPLTEAEKLQEEIAHLEKQCEEKKTEQEMATREGKSAEEELKKRQERKISFLQSYTQSFQGKAPSLGNFEEELGFFEERKAVSGEKARKAGEELEAFQKEMEEKKKTLSAKQEEEEKVKQEAVSREAVSAQQESQIQHPESSGGNAGVVPELTGRSEGIKEYWGALSWEEKKKIFLVRDAVVQKIDEGLLSWEEFLDRFASLALESVVHEVNLEKMRETKDVKGSALLLSIAAHRGGKIQEIIGN